MTRWPPRIAKIRSRWKEAAAGDLLEAQLALDQGNPAAASAAFDAALKKDPNNKMVLFWKAQLDSRIGAAPEAARTLEEIVKERPTKELDTGLTLTAAAESALANLAFANGDLDTAIGRFEDLRNGGTGTLSRTDRWQLVAAYVAKGQWDTAKQEMNALLNDLKSPPTNDERVGAADIYRRQGDLAAAQAQLDYVLKVNPNHPAAVVTQASMLADAKKLDAAAALLRKTIADSGEKPHPVFFLMLAAVENRMPPADTAGTRAWPLIDQGLAVQPDAVELVEGPVPARPPDRRRQGGGGVCRSQGQGRGDNDDLRRLLVEVSVEQKDFAGAERIAPHAAQEEPQGFGVASNLVRLALIQATEAASRNDDAQRRASEDKAAALLREFRAQFPGDLAFVRHRVRPGHAPRRPDSRSGADPGDGQDRQELDRRPAHPRLTLRRPGTNPRGRRCLRRGARAEPPAAECPAPVGTDPPEAGRGRRGAPPGQACARRRQGPARRPSPPGQGPGRAARHRQPGGGPPVPGDRAPGRRRSRSSLPSPTPITRAPRSRC